jgi:uncharacterized membrane protein
VRRDEVDHAFQLDRKVAQRGRRADREWLEEVARELHGRPNFSASKHDARLPPTVRGTLEFRQAAFAFTGGKIDQFEGSR